MGPTHTWTREICPSKEMSQKTHLKVKQATVDQIRTSLAAWGADFTGKYRWKERKEWKTFIFTLLVQPLITVEEVESMSVKVRFKGGNNGGFTYLFTLFLLQH